MRIRQVVLVAREYISACIPREAVGSLEFQNVLGILTHVFLPCDVGDFRVDMQRPTDIFPEHAYLEIVKPQEKDIDNIIRVYVVHGTVVQVLNHETFCKQNIG